MTDNEYCCETLQQVAEQFDFPFYRPLMISGKLDIQVAPLSIRLLKKTPAGNISNKGGATLVMYYCPICGTELVPLKEGE